MKKLLSILFLAAFVVSAIAQERTVFINKTANNDKPYDLTTTKTVIYTGTASDYLIPTTRDTIDFYVLVNNYDASSMHYYAEFKLSPIAGADTTVSITVLSKKTANDTYETVKAAATSAAVTSTIYVENTSFNSLNANDTTGLKYYTSAKTNGLLSYRYLLFRVILKGNDSVGTGIKVERIELQFYPR